MQSRPGRPRVRPRRGLEMAWSRVRRTCAPAARALVREGVDQCVLRDLERGLEAREWLRRAAAISLRTLETQGVALRDERFRAESSRRRERVPQWLAGRRHALGPIEPVR